MIRSALNRVSAARRQIAVGATLAAANVAAFAQAGDPFTTALADATTKVGTYASALVGLAAVGVGFMIAIKYVKKIRGAA
jgi:hypothetical protein